MAACWAHAVHDGLTDLIYILLPVWQAELGIGYAQLGLMRTLYAGTMAGFQLVASHLARWVGAQRLLVGGTVVAGSAYLLAGQTHSVMAVSLALILGGIGASTQHPLASALVANAFHGDRSQQALATYNFSGDIGKMLVPATISLLLAWLTWQQCVTLVGGVGLFAAGVLAALLPHDVPVIVEQSKRDEAWSPLPARFWALFCSGLIDSATRMGFLTLLPFALRDKGANSATIGLALALVFLGGALGKLVCGHLSIRAGAMKTVWLTEVCTAICIINVLLLPLLPGLLLFPLLGVVLNGTSSALYGMVPELAAGHARRERAFALFYSGTIGGGALSPLLFGWVSDLCGVPLALVGTALLVLLTLPMMWYTRSNPARTRCSAS